MHTKNYRVSPAVFRRFQFICSWLHFCEDFSLLPFPLRLALLHVGVTAVYLLISPPIEVIPPIFIPIVWAASFATTQVLWSLGRLILRKAYG